MVYVVALEVLPGSAEMTIHPLQTARITVLKQDEALTKVSPENADYADIFSFNPAIEIAKNIGINKYTIKLQDGKKPPNRPIYSLRSVELKILKTYIKTHLKTGFILSSKFFADTSILFNKKPDGSLWLCVDYQGLNKLMINNWYPLFLIGETLNQLRKAKQFT